MTGSGGDARHRDERGPVVREVVERVPGAERADAAARGDGTLDLADRARGDHLARGELVGPRPVPKLRRHVTPICRSGGRAFALSISAAPPGGAGAGDATRPSIGGMRAIVYAEKGPSSVMRLAERPVPEPGPGQVRVRLVRAGREPDRLEGAGRRVGAHGVRRGHPGPGRRGRRRRARRGRARPRGRRPGLGLPRPARRCRSARRPSTAWLTGSRVVPPARLAGRRGGLRPRRQPRRPRYYRAPGADLGAARRPARRRARWPGRSCSCRAALARSATPRSSSPPGQARR